MFSNQSFTVLSIFSFHISKHQLKYFYNYYEKVVGIFIKEYLLTSKINPFNRLYLLQKRSNWISTSLQCRIYNSK